MAPKYDKPKIMLLDMGDKCEAVLRDAGYNVSVGTFGYPCDVKRSTKVFPVVLDGLELPNFEEQEIIVANTLCPPATGDSPAESPGDGVSGIWQEANRGSIDPRPLSMTHARHAFGRILNHGGIAIVMLSRRYEVKYFGGSLSSYAGFRDENEFKLSNWSFLRQLDKLESSDDDGSEIKFVRKSGDFGALLKRGVKGANFTCTVSPDYQQESNWISVATNKYDDCVAGVLMKDDPKCCLIVLPQMPEFHSVLPELIGYWCAQWRPHLFPYHEGKTWLFKERYELPEITQLRKEKQRIETEAEEQAQQLDTKIQEIREENKDWYTLLNGTGGELVGAVIRALERLGFKQVIDVDGELRAEGEIRNLREDIRIHDQSPILVIDVKGIAGCPEDAGATQSEKHALMRAKEFQGDVQPLTIINHERNIPPHDRNPNPYRKEIIENAEQTGLGLMTTWDLFRLLQNKDALGWRDDNVKAVLYRKGRIEPIPSHYAEVGIIAHAWERALGVVPTQPVGAGSRFAIEIGDRFEEIVAETLQVNDDPVNEAPAGSDCGIACDNADGRFKKGMRIFVVAEPSSK